MSLFPYMEGVFSMIITIPASLLRDRYWASLIHLFQNNSRLIGLFTDRYFDLEIATVEINKLKKATSGWSNSEKIMMNLALHLFNERNKFNLSDLDYLDSYNKKLAFEAMLIRFKN
jgi:hypothetical protein